MRSPCCLFVYVSMSVFCRSITCHTVLIKIVLLSVPDHYLFVSADVIAGYPGLKSKVNLVF
jgi:hypothetical protein